MNVGLKKKFHETFRFYPKARDMYNPFATAKLSPCYLFGKCVEKNCNRAFHLIQAASELKEPASLKILADYFLHGIAGEQIMNQFEEKNSF